MIGDAREHLAQICFRIESVQFCRPDQTIEGCGTIPAAIRSREQVVLPANGNGANKAVIQTDPELAELVPGFLARKRGSEPGMITLWRGLIRLNAMVAGARAALRHIAPQSGPP